MTDKPTTTIDVDLPSDLHFGNETWRVRNWSRVIQPNGVPVLVATFVPVIGGRMVDEHTCLRHECNILGAAIGGSIAKNTPSDEVAGEFAREVADAIFEFVRYRHALISTPTGKPN